MLASDMRGPTVNDALDHLLSKGFYSLVKE